MPDETSSNELPPALPEVPKPVARWRWWVHLMLVAGYLAWIGAAGFFVSESTSPALSSTAGGLLLTSVFTLLSFGLVVGGAWLASRATCDDLLLRWRPGFWPVPLGVLYSLALRIGIGVFAVAVMGVLLLSGVYSTAELQTLTQESRPNVEALVDVVSLRNNPAYFWLMITLVSFVVAGLREELWRAAFLAGLRGLWPKAFASRKAQVVGVLIAAVLFGSAHTAQGLAGCVMAGLLGFGLGLIMVLHRSIWPAVIAHGFFNATSFALIPYALEKLQELQQVVQP